MNIGDTVRLKLSYYTGIVVDIYPSTPENTTTYCAVEDSKGKVELFNQDDLEVYEPCNGCFFGCPVCECGIL